MANTARYESASEIVNAAAVEVGLTKNNAPFSSPDPTFKQLIQLLTVCGRWLCVKYGWTMAAREGSITVVAGQTEYPLPDDFMSLVDSTTYGPNSDKLYGSASPQMWTLWNKENPSVSFQVLFRLARRMFVIPATVPAGTVLTYEYRSRAWVLSGTASGVYKDKVDDPGDVVLFESVLVSRLLVAKFLRSKGFDATGALAEFADTLEAVRGTDAPAEILDVSSPRSRTRFLDENNVPDTGFGS